MKDVVIVGNGPAVYMAAIYTHTANLCTLVIDETSCPEPAFLGYDKVAGVVNARSPRDLIDLMQQQVAKFGTERICAEVTRIVLHSTISVHTDRDDFDTRCVIVDGMALAQRIFGKGADVSDLAKKGVFVCGHMQGVPNEAIVLIGSGCQASFSVKDFVAK